jgi:hypothetical protein
MINIYPSVMSSVILTSFSIFQSCLFSHISCDIPHSYFLCHQARWGYCGTTIEAQGTEHLGGLVEEASGFSDGNRMGRIWVYG